MGTRVYRAPTMREALAQVRKDLGRDALILDTREVIRPRWLGRGHRPMVEIVATREDLARPRWATDSGGRRRWRLDAGTGTAEAESNSSEAVREQLDQALGKLHEVIDELARQGRFEHLIPDVPQALASSYATLLDREVPEPLARRIIRLLADVLDPEELRSAIAIEAALIRMVEMALPIAAPISVVPGVRRIVALVGPSGTGKTTMVARLAAAAKVDRGLRVGLLTLDEQRIGAVDRLRTYAEIIDLPMRGTSLAGRTGPMLADLGDLDLVLIDTPGLAPRDRHKLRELADRLAESRPDETHLVLSAGLGERAIRSAVEAFSAVGVDRLILTKLDEADRAGAVLAAPGPSSLPFSYLTTGAGVPDDFEPARRARLSRLILGLEPASMGAAQPRTHSPKTKET